jgi:2-desacetyl-2-hydroxyethyl bacteriochlorophyllide A dehydrogenase
MKAMRFHEYGSPEVLRLDEIEAPKAAAGQLLIRMMGSSVNPIDWKLASGAYRLVMPVRRPAVPGYDLVGEVVELGAGVSEFSVGDRVVAQLTGKIGATGGTTAEFVVAAEEHCALLPDGVSVESAAVLPLAGMTALQALRDDCGMNPSGDPRRVLIVGGSGGVGHYAVQLAHHFGAHVTAVCSTSRMEIVSELGADHVIDYTKVTGFASGAPYDIIVDCAAIAPWAQFAEVLTAGGVLSQPTVSAKWIPRLLVTNLFTKRRIRATLLKQKPGDLDLLLGLMSEGKLKSLVGASFHYTDLASAWSRNQTGGVLGKIAISY